MICPISVSYNLTATDTEAYRIMKMVDKVIIETKCLERACVKRVQIKVKQKRNKRWERSEGEEGKENNEEYTRV